MQKCLQKQKSKQKTMFVFKLNFIENIFFCCFVFSSSSIFYNLVDILLIPGLIVEKGQQFYYWRMNVSHVVFLEIISNGTFETFVE